MTVTATRATTERRTEKGLSLARGPALILGTILLVAGLYFLYKQHTFPKLSNFPNGSAPVPGKVFLGIFGANGWTGMLTAAAGGLLLFGAAQHLLAKTMSLIVAVALGAAAIISLASGDVLGLAAANHWTELGWGAVAVILLFNTVIPRRRRTVAVAENGTETRTGTGTGTGTVAPVRRAAPATAAADAEPATSTGATRGTVADRGDGYTNDPTVVRSEAPASADHDDASVVQRDPANRERAATPATWNEAEQ